MNLAKRLTEIQKNEIKESFSNGKTIEELAKSFNCTKLTISRNLKKQLGIRKYENEIEKRKSERIPLLNIENEAIENNNIIPNESLENPNNQKFNYAGNQANTFLEIAPIDCVIDNGQRKDLTSVSIQEFVFPKIVYMVVDNKIELTIKKLGDYPNWQFLPENELNRGTIEIYSDMKIAKRFCSKDQKIIKVPNTNVFKIVAPILLSRGISRIVNSENLIAL